jgi:hypothetical protein
MKKNLILGLAAGYHWEQLRIFVDSIRNTSYKDHIALFFDSELDPRTMRQLKENDVECIHFDRQQALSRSGINHIPLSLLRVSLYLEFLKERADNYQNVMLSDTRDVVFQKDPFAFDFRSSLCFFMEPEPTLIKDNDWNSIWIIAAAGTKVYQSISGNPISCFGTTLGPMDKVIEYLQMIKRLSSKAKIMFWGIEQGMHNYIVHAKLIEGISCFSSEDGPVFTIGAGYTGNLQQDSSGHFLNRKNEIIHAIHQYDRYAQLKEYFDKKFRSNIRSAEI